MSHPSYEEFYAALADPSRRPEIGLAISDDDAWSLLENDDWAHDYYADWLALPPVEQAPVEQAPDAAGPTPPDDLPVAPPVLLVEPPPAPQPAPVKRVGLPRWAVGAIAGGAAVALLCAVGVGALVYTGITAAGGESDAGGTPAPAASETPAPEADGDLLPWDEGYVAPYSEAEAAEYLAIVEPLFDSVSSGSTDMSQSYLLFGSSACVSLAAGFAGSEVVDPIVQASNGKLTADEGQTMLDAAKTYLCE